MIISFLSLYQTQQHPPPISFPTSSEDKEFFCQSTLQPGHFKMFLLFPAFSRIFRTLSLLAPPSAHMQVQVPSILRQTPKTKYPPLTHSLPQILSKLSSSLLKTSNISSLSTRFFFFFRFSNTALPWCPFNLSNHMVSVSSRGASSWTDSLKIIFPQNLCLRPSLP